MSAARLNSGDLAKPLSLMDRQAHLVFPISLLLYLILQLYVNYLLASGISRCSSAIAVAPWVRFVNFGSAFAFSLSLFQQIGYIHTLLLSSRLDKYSLVRVRLLIVGMDVIAGSSSALSFLHGDAGICVDAFGVASIAGQWSEWIVSVPLLGYLACAVVNRNGLFWLEYVAVLSLALMIFFGFVLNLEVVASSRLLAIACVLASFGSVVVVCVIAVLSTKADKTETILMELHEVFGGYRSSLLSYVAEAQIDAKKTLFQNLFLVLCYFSVIYLLAVVQIFNQDQILAAYMVGSVFGKLVFCNVLANHYLELQEDFHSILESECTAREMRVSFLRYLFHEVRVPLNALSMGIQVLKHPESGKNLEILHADRSASTLLSGGSENEKPPAAARAISTHRGGRSRVSSVASDEGSLNTLSLMESSVEDIQGVLNNVLLMYQLDVGRVKLKSAEFDVGALIARLEASVKDVQETHGVRIEFLPSASLPKHYVGDEHELETALQQLLTSAVVHMEKGGMLSFMIDHKSKSYGWTKTWLDFSRCGSMSPSRNGSTWTDRLPLICWRLLKAVVGLLGSLQSSIRRLGVGAEDDATNSASIPACYTTFNTTANGVGCNGTTSDTSADAGIGAAAEVPSDGRSSIPEMRDSSASAGDGERADSRGDGNEAAAVHARLDHHMVKFTLSSRDFALPPDEMRRRFQLYNFGSRGGSCSIEKARMKKAKVRPHRDDGNSAAQRMHTPPPHIPASELETGDMYTRDADDVAPAASAGRGSDKTVGEATFATTELMSSVGVGLTLAKNVIAMLGGSVRCSITMPVPLSSSSSPPSSLPPVSELPRGKGAGSMGGHRGPATEIVISVPMQVFVKKISSAADEFRFENEIKGVSGELSVSNEALQQSNQMRFNISQLIIAATSNTANPTAVLDQRLLHILVVDDTPSNYKMLSRLVRLRGHSAEIAKNGKEALDMVLREGAELRIEQLESPNSSEKQTKLDKRSIAEDVPEFINPFDLIFMDHTMPVMSGVESTRRLREAGYSNLLIGVTGNALDVDMETFVAAGADLVLAKPICERHLNAIDTFVRENGTRAPKKRGFLAYEETEGVGRLIAQRPSWLP